MLIMTLASGTEAMHTGRSIHEVWTSPESESDRRDALQDGYRAGLIDDQITGFINEALERSEQLIQQVPVQRAIKDVADALSDQGRMTGRRAAFIINRALQESTAPALQPAGFR